MLFSMIGRYISPLKSSGHGKQGGGVGGGEGGGEKAKNNIIKKNPTNISREVEDSNRNSALQAGCDACFVRAYYVRFSYELMQDILVYRSL